MDIYEYNKYLIESRGERGYSFLAERVPESAGIAYNIRVVTEPIRPNDAMLVALGGDGGGANIAGHNGLIKYVTNFIKTIPELHDARIHVAICNFGTKYPERGLRRAFTISKRYPLIWSTMQKFTARPIKQLYDPLPAQDIYRAIIQPKVTDGAGQRITLNTMLKNMRGITFLAYCAGGHTAMQIEEFAHHTMAKRKSKWHWAKLQLSGMRWHARIKNQICDFCHLNPSLICKTCERDLRNIYILADMISE